MFHKHRELNLDPNSYINNWKWPHAPVTLVLCVCVGRQEDDQSLLAASCRAVGPYLEEIRWSDKIGHLMSSSRLCIHKHGHMCTYISYIYTIITEKMAEVPLTTTQASGHTLFQ